MEIVVRIWIGNPHKSGKFNGTAFFINGDTLITAKHVISNNQQKIYDHIHITDTVDGGVVPIDRVDLCERDIAILKVKKKFNVSNISYTDALKEGCMVKIWGFHDANGSRKSNMHHVSGYLNTEHTYELQSYLTSGLSGSPVFLDDKICGITQAINTKKNITYIIPVSEICMDLEMQERQDISKMVENNHFSIILSRRYMNISAYEKKVIEILSQKRDFDVKVLHIRRYEYDLWKEMKILFNLKNEKEVESELNKKFKNSDKKILLIIRNFEDIDKDLKNRFASLLRALLELSDSENFYLIIFGGKELARLAYENGKMSLFSNVNNVSFSEKQEYKLSDTIKEITGDHPRLNNLCKDISIDESEEYYQNFLKKSPALPMIFNFFKFDDKLCRYFEEQDFGSYNTWNNDKLIRDLFWENLLKESNGRLVWRSEFIRQIGKELRCET